MPASTPDSSDLPPPSATPSAEPDAEAEPRARWHTNALLFLATVGTIFFAHSFNWDTFHGFSHLSDAFAFTGTLLAILVAHESAHYIAARIHKVDASLPYFIPMPLPPFGTMGAVIRMRGTIPTRRALLDIGASGPLAGLTLAIPLYVWGLMHSKLVAVGDGGTTLGDSLLARALTYAVGIHPPAGMDVELGPVAFGAWAGFFVTMINLIPVSQLDGGHVAYALLGPRQDKVAVFVHRAMLAFVFVSIASYAIRDVRAGIGLHHIDSAVGNSMFWLMWFQVLSILGTLSARGQGGASARAADEGIPIRTRVTVLLGLVAIASVGHDHSSPLLWIAWFAGLGLFLAMEAKSGVLRRHTLVDHPSTGAEPLDITRKIVAVVTLVFFALLFMATPMAM